MAQEEQTKGSRDQLTPEIISEHLRSHDRKMYENRDEWALAKATYMTRFWRHVRGGGSYTSDTSRSRTSDIDIEVNRLWQVIQAYLSALYPRAARTVMSPDPAGEGDPVKAELAVNRWLVSSKIHQRVMSALRQGLLYPGCGVKVGYTPGYGNPLDRVWMRVIPWWEMILDSDVGDVEDERFRGHVYYRPVRDVEEEYGLEDLSGTERLDFLRDRSSVGTQSNKGNDRAPSDNQAFVRVLEICNLVDIAKDKEDDSVEYKGRLEIYVMGQGALSKKPVFTGPLPFAESDGRAMSHIIPLVFNHEPEYPLRGISHSARIMPQLKELNSYRSFMAIATRKDTRQYVTRKGTFSSDELTNLTEGHDGLVLEAEQGFEKPLADAIIPIQNAPISSNIDRYLMQVENDLERCIGFSPAARGIVTKATAFEVQAVQQYTESEYGMHAAIKDEWLSGLVRLVLRALIASMQDTGDSAGAYEDQEVELSSTEAKPDTEEDDESETKKEVQSAVADDISGKESPFVDDDVVEDRGKTRVDEDTVEVSFDTLTLKDRDEPVEITPMDLDAAFDISFVEGGRTPMTDAAMQQNLVGLMEPYIGLWGAVQQGGPGSVMARAYMKVLAERFDLPKDLHPDELAIRIKEQEEEDKEKKKEARKEARKNGAAPEEAAPAMGPPQGPPGPPQGPPGPPQPQGAPMGPPAGGMPSLEEVAMLPPDQAIPMLREMFADDPEMQAALDQLMQMPPEQQQRALSVLAQGPEVAPM